MERVIFYSVITIFMVLLLVMPDKVLFSEGSSLCFHKMVFGVQCPLCGMTRGVHEMLHLRFYEALHYNVMVLFLPLYVLVDLGNHFSPNVISPKFKKWFLYIGLGGLVLLYAYRMVTFFS